MVGSGLEDDADVVADSMAAAGRWWSPSNCSDDCGGDDVLLLLLMVAVWMCLDTADTSSMDCDSTVMEVLVIGKKEPNVVVLKVVVAAMMYLPL